MENLSEFEANQKDLIHILHKIQAEYGYIPSQALSSISKHLKISESEIFGVLTFYKAFSLKPRGKHLVTICMGTACHVRGAPMILDELKRQLSIEPGETTEDDLFTLETVNCVGACALGPIVISDGNYHGQMKTREVNKLINKIKKEIKE
ncbi:MAG: NAD(P)H-dependent oxidoreductase subunit E [Candidatus Aminicenantes bacterium]|nr:NAD(P)H-dependent oxidoreductase subunit E [Candidatus Aminicenantes bacterium]TET25164.1 MAG: NAD(P)H-dependent oxidoreductase subunit E [Candidatus Aminicenantes bacterium]